MKQKETKKTKRAKKAVKTGLSLMNLKVSDKDRRLLTAQARKYAKGNLSAWLRFAGTHFHPSKSQRFE